MEITYKMTVIDMKSMPVQSEAPGFVVHILYSMSGDVVFNEKEYRSEVTNFVSFDIKKTEYTPYENLTEKDVIEWVEMSIGSDGVELLKKNIYNDIELQINPPLTPQSEKLPWL